MFRALLAKLRRASASGERSERASILVPFLIIAAGLGVLAWRSYQLSVRMERGAKTIAMQYAGYAAEITARRVDAAARSELLRAARRVRGARHRADVVHRRRLGEPPHHQPGHELHRPDDHGPRRVADDARPAQGRGDDEAPLRADRQRLARAAHAAVDDPPRR